MSAQIIAIPPNYTNVEIQQMSVTTSATVIPAFSTTGPFKNASRCESIFVQAPATNSATITLGKSGVTAGGAGIELVAGGNITLPSNDRSFWYAISASGTQKLNVIYQGSIN